MEEPEGIKMKEGFIEITRETFKEFGIKQKIVFILYSWYFIPIAFIYYCYRSIKKKVVEG